MIRHLPLVLTVLTGPSFAQTCSVDLTAGAPQPDAAYGTSVAFSGDRAAIGAPGEDGGDGAVHIYRRTGSSQWVLQSRLQPPVAGVAGGFGAAVDFGNTADDWLIVGAPGEQQSAGAAYVYRISPSGVGDLRGAVASSSPGDQLGRAVSVDGALALVGAPGRDAPGAPAAGAVHVLTFGTTWTEAFQLHPPVAQPGMAFGASVDNFGLRAIVGAPFAGGPMASAGAAFEYNVFGSGQLLGTLESSSPQGSGHFGSAVAIGERRVVVGEPGFDGPAADSGAVHVYRRSSPNPATASALEDRLELTAPVQGGRFGASVAIRRTMLMAGHPGADRAEVFVRRPDLTWDPGYGYLAPPAAAGFGAAVATHDGVHLVGAAGAPRGLPPAQGAGAAYIWDLRDGDCDANGQPDVCSLLVGLTPDCNGNFRPDACDLAMGTSADENGNLVPDECEALGDAYCQPGAPNTWATSGATLEAVGSGLAGTDDVHLLGSDLPPQQFALLINGTAAGFDPFPGGALGILCLGGTLGRHVDDVARVSGAGTVNVPLRLHALPSGSVAVPVAAGQTWRFQLWYRDAFNGVSVSNFSSALEITFS